MFDLLFFTWNVIHQVTVTESSRKQRKAVAVNSLEQLKAKGTTFVSFVLNDELDLNC